MPEQSLLKKVGDCQGHQGGEGLTWQSWGKVSSKPEEHQVKSMAEVALVCLRNSIKASMASTEHGRGSGLGREVREITGVQIIWELRSL